MVTSSRTPEGQPDRCPVCGHQAALLPSEPIADAPCPNCGTLIWPIAASESSYMLATDALSAAERRKLRHLLLRASQPGLSAVEHIELILDFTELLDVSIPDEVAIHVQNLDDLLEYLSSTGGDHSRGLDG